MANSNEVILSQADSLLDQANLIKDTDLKSGNINLGELSKKNYDKKTTAQNILKKVEGKRKWFQIPPKYFKPGFLLENQTPMVTAKIHMQVQENGKSIVKTWDLFNDKDKTTHNHIRSFKYSPFSPDANANLKAELHIVDVDSTFAEALVLRFAAIMSAASGGASVEDANILIEVEYGWYVPETLKEKYNNQFGDSASVSFTQNVMFFLMKPDFTYNMDGSIEVILKLTADPTLQPPLMWWRPIETFGKYPAMNIAMVQYLSTVIKMWQGIVGDNKTITKIKKFIKTVGQWTYIEYLDASGDKIELRVLIKSLVKVFAPECTTFVDDVLHNGLLKKTTLYATKNASGNASLDRNTKTLRGSEIDPEYISSAGNSLEYLIGQDIGDITNIEDPTDKIDDKFAPLIEGLPKDGTIAILKNMLVREQGRNNLGQEFSKKMSSIKLKAIEGEKDYTTVLNFIEKITPVLLDSYIHPLIVEIYMLREFLSEIESNEKLKANNISVSFMATYISMFDSNKIEPRVTTYKNKEKDSKSFYQYAIEEKQQIFFSRVEKERWCQTVKSFKLDQQTTWVDMLAGAISAQRVAFETNDAGDIDTLKSGDYKAEKIKGTSKTFYVPVQAKANTFITDSKGAAENFKNMEKLLLAAQKKNNNKDITDRIKWVKGKLALARRSVSKTPGRWLFILKDILPSSSLFSPGMGNTHILQAYSFRSASTANDSNIRTQWNPGWPKIWDVNFPDVISFQPEFDFFTGIMAVAQNARPMNFVEGKVNLKDNSVLLLQKLNVAMEDVKSYVQSTGKATRKDRGKTGWEKKKENLKEAIADLRAADEDYLVNKETLISKHPVGFNLDFSKRRIGGGNTPETLAGKRSLQEFRKRMIMETLNVKATSTVLGDPSYFPYDYGKFIFNKIINPDGTLSMFTGLYFLNGIDHLIEAGRFETTITAQMDSTAGDPELSGEMENIIYNTDHMIKS